MPFETDYHICYAIQQRIRAAIVCLGGKTKKIAALAVFTILSVSNRSPAEPMQTMEYQVKAAYLYNFAKYVDWSSTETTSALKVCVLGKDPFHEALNDIAGRTAHDRLVTVRHAKKVEEIGDCNIVFIAMSEKGRLQQILHDSHLKGVLTVSDMRHFIDNGGMIGFVTQGEKIRFEINNKAANKAGLKISSQLLKLATGIM